MKQGLFSIVIVLFWVAVIVPLLVISDPYP